MKVNPVRRYAEPMYPTSITLEQHPERPKFVPRRWRGNLTVVMALIALCLISSSRLTLAADSRPDKGAGKVAPIFQHGEGRVLFGRHVVLGPVSLSEAEARQVVVQVAKRAGIKFEPGRQPMPGVTPPIFDTFGHMVPIDKRILKSAALRVQPDGTDERLGISYVFVSYTDFTAWQQNTGDAQVTIALDWPDYTYDLEQAAQLLDQRISSSNPEQYVAVFYDPLVAAPVMYDKSGNNDWQATIRNNWEKGKEISRKQLGEQVRDFIKWLRAQGVI